MLPITSKSGGESLCKIGHSYPPNHIILQSRGCSNYLHSARLPVGMIKGLRVAAWRNQRDRDRRRPRPTDRPLRALTRHMTTATSVHSPLGIEFCMGKNNTHSLKEEGAERGRGKTYAFILKLLGNCEVMLRLITEVGANRYALFYIQNERL